MWINWRGDLEWSDGTPVTLAPFDEANHHYRSVSAPPSWTSHVGENYVSVDANTGLILGCEQEDYPHVRNVAKHPAVWLHLFHGRSDDYDIDGWGFNGPTIGPLDYVHVTYMCDVKYGFQDGHDATSFGLEQDGHLNIVDGCIELNGRRYGDFSINAFKPTGLYEIEIIERGTDEVIHAEQFDGTSLEAEHKLSDIWNERCAHIEAGRVKAVLSCISGDGKYPWQTIEPLGDDE